jgi:hypothetical protein
MRLYLEAFLQLAAAVQGHIAILPELLIWAKMAALVAVLVEAKARDSPEAKAHLLKEMLAEEEATIRVLAEVEAVAAVQAQLGLL